MDIRARKLPIVHLAVILVIALGCSSSKKVVPQKSIAPNIDLSHWKVTIPTSNGRGGAMEVMPPEIMDYPNIEALKEFMYPDSSDGSIVFFAYSLSSTANSKYSRTELREQLVPGDNSVNWKFSEGAYMKVQMSVPEVSKDENGKAHRVIVAQIHGKLTKEQQKLIGQKDTNAPPVLKVYYQDGFIEVRTKVLAVNKPSVKEVLVTKNWKDDKGHYFAREVGKRKFTLEVIVSDGRLEVVLDGNEKVVYNSKSTKQWDVFGNYFKTGNYLNTRDEDAYAKVKIYELEVSH